MFISFDSKEALAIIESAAYNVIAEMAEQSKIEDAEKEGKYNLGYTDGASNLCESLKAKIREHVREQEEKLEAYTAPAAAVDDEKKEDEPAAAKYDN